MKRYIKRYITTAISYTNGNPHIGHAYEFVLADILARWHELQGETVYFLTGTDEHGQKIAEKASSLGKTPKQLCDEKAEIFKQLDHSYDIQYDNFIRTTDPYHKQVVYELYNACKANKDIYLGQYVGWYNVKEETFVTELQAKMNNFVDPTTKIPLKKVAEPSYFFKLSRFRDAIVQHIQIHPNFIRPKSARNSILKRLTENSLTDLSISRQSVAWGIKVPDDETHTFYVWFDALANYLSGCGKKLDVFWPPDIQVIGKDITWFHAVIWMGMLMSASLPLPKCIFVHNFVNDKDGVKMSKSLGNVVDPMDLVAKYPSDVVRFYIAKETTCEHDVRFSEKGIIQSNDNDLLPRFGNLITRVCSLLGKYNQRIVPETDFEKPIFDLANLRQQCTEFMQNYDFGSYVRILNEHFDLCNNFINATHMWTIQNPKYSDDTRSEQDRLELLCKLAKAVLILSHFLGTICPQVSAQVFRNFANFEPKTLDVLSWNNCLSNTTQNPIVVQNPKLLLFNMLDEKRAKQKKQKNLKKKNLKN